MSYFPNLNLQIHTSMDELASVLEEVDKMATLAQWSPAFQLQVGLVIEELVVNAITYGGQRSTQGWIRLKLTGDDRGLHIQLEDNGIAFDPFYLLPPPDTESDLEDRPIGGLGVHLVRKMTDEQSYERIGGVNRIQLTKVWAR
jgi:anti-sigma regulatory factor (Ser/Thr protein kinase)